MRIWGKGILRRGNSKCKNSEVEKCLRTAEITLQKDECHNEAHRKLWAPKWWVSAFASKLEETQRGSITRGGIFPTWQESRESR